MTTDDNIVATPSHQKNSLKQVVVTVLLQGVLIYTLLFFRTFCFLPRLHHVVDECGSELGGLVVVLVVDW